MSNLSEKPAQALKDMPRSMRKRSPGSNICNITARTVKQATNLYS